MPAYDRLVDRLRIRRGKLVSGRRKSRTGLLAVHPFRFGRVTAGFCMFSHWIRSGKALWGNRRLGLTATVRLRHSVWSPLPTWRAIICVLVAVATVVLVATLRQLIGELRAMRIQSEAWSRIHDNATRQSGLLDEVLAESVYIRKKMNDALGSLFGGLEIRRNLQSLQHMHDLLQTLHDRRRDVAEVHHVGFLRHRLGELSDKIEEIQHAVEVMQNSLGCTA